MTISLTPYHISPYAEYVMAKIFLNWRIHRIDFDDPVEFGWQITKSDDVDLDEFEYYTVTKKSQAINQAIAKRLALYDGIPTKPNAEFVHAYENLADLSLLLNLNHTEFEVLRFFVHTFSERALCNILNRTHVGRLNNCYQLIANVLNLPPIDMQKALTTGRLGKLKLIELSINYSHDDFLDYFSFGDGIAIGKIMTANPEKSWLSHCVISPKDSELSLDDFAHLDEYLEILKRYLAVCQSKNAIGANILLHGRAGTGKSELASLLGKNAGYDVQLIAFESKTGERYKAKQRLSNYALCDTILKDSNALFVFDEVDDIFERFGFTASESSNHKAWLNGMLESNHRPTIWIGNNMVGTDPAFIRRFDLVLEMPDMPANIKCQLIQKNTRLPLSDTCLDSFAQTEGLTAGIVARGLKVVNQIADYPFDNALDPSLVATKIFEQTLKAQGLSGIKSIKKSQYFNPNFINCKENLDVITKQLASVRQGRILCYGAAGTGKTAWAEHLAKELNLKPLSIKASDILGGLVGESEQNIARAFDTAKKHNHLLIIDEADSFLYERTHAKRSWEMTMVNEMLTQMENFDGILVCSTNLMDSMDKAVLRRFDIKLSFRHLAGEKLIHACCHHWQALELGEPSDDKMRLLTNLHNAALGDLASLSRRHRFSPFLTADDWIDALNGECLLKEGRMRRIGF